MKLTVPEAARRVGRSSETVRRWIWTGRLPSEKVGNQHLVETDALDELVAPRALRSNGRTAAVGGEWGDWLERAAALERRLRARQASLPAAADMLRESRRGR